MIGGGFRIVQDVPPYVLAGNEPLRYAGLNLIGLRRRGFSNNDIMILKKAYQLLYESGLNVSQAKKRIGEELGENQYVKNVLKFLDASNRGIIKR